MTKLMRFKESSSSSERLGKLEETRIQVINKSDRGTWGCSLPQPPASCYTDASQRFNGADGLAWARIRYYQAYQGVGPPGDVGGCK